MEIKNIAPRGTTPFFAAFLPPGREAPRTGVVLPVGACLFDERVSSAHDAVRRRLVVDVKEW